MRRLRECGIDGGSSSIRGMPSPRLPAVARRLGTVLGLFLACQAHAAALGAACEREALEALGWRFAEDDVAAPVIEPGTPCDRASLAEAHAAGDLRVQLPAALDATQHAALHAALRAHPATVCAHGFAIGEATRRAVDRLVANRGFRFSLLQLGWIGFGPTGPARDGWEPMVSFGRAYRPRGRNSNAILGFYAGEVRAECGVGRQVAQYAAQAELYGAAGFDTAFAADEIVIGTFNQLRASDSVLLGATAGEFVHDGLARKASARGRQAFMGLPGFIFHAFDRRYLDDLHNQAENFVVYDVDAAAAGALRAHGGFAHYNARNREAWELARTLPPADTRRYFERLLHERDPGLRAALDTTSRATVARIDALLADPFYRGFHVYVHKLGVRPVGYHVVRLLDRNPRTPFRIELGLHNVHTTLLRRYIDYRTGTCQRQGPAEPSPSAFQMPPS